MFKITQNNRLNTLIVNDDNNQVFGEIHLNDGGSLQKLTLNNKAIIQDLAPLSYQETYASSILFPFANRVDHGKYNFNNKTFQLDVNVKAENNAMHGLVYNKTFNVLNMETSKNEAAITLEYIEPNKSTGFPYSYSIQLKYIFTQKNLCLQVSIKNTDCDNFPFTLGWHPYFVSDHLFESQLNFNATKKLIIGNRNITTGVEDIPIVKNFKIEDKKLDDCWILNSNKVLFKTPKYNLTLVSSAKNNFLQAYTPPKKNTIAIEPTTGVSNSFNNNIGLQVLKANETYAITWQLTIN